MYKEARDLFPENEQLVRDYERALEKGSFEVEMIPESSTSPTPEISATAATTLDKAIIVESPPGTIFPSFSLIMGILFIGAAVVLMIIAIRRREKSDPSTD